MSKNFTKDILKAQNGDKDILQKIVQENQGLIWGIVKRFSGRGYEVEDLYQIGAIGFNGTTYCCNFEQKYDASYHGTGDVFTSALTGSIVQGKSLEEAIKIATKFTTEAVRLTYEDINGIKYGVNFEQAIPYLVKLLHCNMV